ncbi:MAG TPA: magnesium transporter [Rhodothermales bacterium]|nr:magnesium transporter [Rhodothermales bacterium]
MSDVSEGKERAVLLPEVDNDLVEDIASLIESGQRGMVVNLLTDLYPADIASMLHHLPTDDARTLFDWLPKDIAGEVVPELDDEYRAGLLQFLPSHRIGEVLDEMESDDAADVLADLPRRIVEDVLHRLEDAAEVKGLLEYEEDTAGGIMGTDYVAVLESMTVGEATEEVRRNAESVEPIFAVYVVDASRRLLGIVPLKRLLLSRANARVSMILESDIISVTPEVDQEEVARRMERYDLVAIPVVDAERRLIGRITVDDVIDVIREEAEEDIQRMSGLSREEMTSSVIKMSRGRLIWLLVGLIGAFLSAIVIHSFAGEIEKAVVLAMFIPVVMAMGGNAGIQSSSIAVQGLASGDIWATDLLRRLGKELAVALINGLVLAVAITVMVIAISYTGFLGNENIGRLSLTVALTLLTVIIMAGAIGAAIPLVLDRFGIDPALATGPFITTSNDLLGLIVYFVIATQLYL